MDLLSRIVSKLLSLVLINGTAGVFVSGFFLLLAGLLFVPLEQLLDAPRRGEQPRRRERLADVLHALFNPAFAGVVAVAVGTALTPSTFHRLLVPPLGATNARWAAGWLRWSRSFGEHLDRDLHLPVAMLLSAFFGYWLHRALHEWGVLWRLHAVHHSSERVGWLSAHRQHPVEVGLIVVTTVAPGIVLGLSPKTIAAVVVFQKLHLFFSHTRTRLPLGPLRYLIVTPRHHHWHHEIDARCNYAGLFPFLDMLFGTYRDEAHFPARTGTHSHVHRGFFAHLLHPLRRRRTVESELCWCRVDDGRPAYGRQAERQRQRLPSATDERQGRAVGCTAPPWVARAAG